jgi:hypothetical protein
MKTCSRCGKQSEQTGEVCQHLVHGELLTYYTAPSDGSGLPDTACTACFALYEKLDNAPEVWSTMRLHVICEDCYPAIVAKHVLPTQRDMERGFAIVSRKRYASAKGMDVVDASGHCALGSFAKLAFAPLPSQHPLSVEKMWVRIEGLDRDALEGVLDNDPEHFDPDVLKAGDKIEFSRDDVLEVMT